MKEEIINGKLYVNNIPLGIYIYGKSIQPNNFISEYFLERRLRKMYYNK